MMLSLAARAVRPPGRKLSLERGDSRARNSRVIVASSGGSEPAPPPPTGIDFGVDFVLCRPEGPINVGSAARAMQNFGISGLRIVRPMSTVLAAQTGETASSGEPRLLDEEAYKFAVSSRWMLERDDLVRNDVRDAVEEATLVVATTARPRENLPLLSLKDGCERIAQEIRDGGRAAVLFGNERTGLMNEELELAEFGMCVPTIASVAESSSSGKYTGGGGADKQTTKPVSLNLGMAVGVVAYELFNHITAAQNKDPVIRGFSSHRLTVGERGKLIDDVCSARRAVDLFGDVDDEEDIIFAEKERRSITSALTAGPMSSRDVTPLFMLARRAIAMAELADAEQKVTNVALEWKKSTSDSSKALNALIKDRLGISLTRRELERVIQRVSTE
jgi:tRNA C32,U32 (ribose-2'-O)-methylase TrmJ